MVCTAAVDELLVPVATAALEWRLPVNAVGVSIGRQSMIGNTSTLTLTFDSIRTSQGGVYGCRATIDITGFDQTVNRTIQVQS